MRKEIIKVIVCAVVFLASVIVISAIMNQGNSDMTTEMEAATFPLVSFETEGTEVNLLHGYSEEMEINYLRDNIICLGEERRLSLIVDKFGADIQSMSFEVRSLDGERLVENTDIYNYNEDDEQITASLQIKDLIDDHMEYKLVILLRMENGNVLRYYTRVIEAEDYHQAELIAFAKDFHERTFNKEAAKEITKYLESNEEGDNTTFSKVNIHSSFSQITWGELQVEREEKLQTSIKEMDAQTAKIQLSYQVSIGSGKKKTFFNVKEFYRLRYGTERIYLLDFERTMEQIFDKDNGVFSSNKISLGITDGNVELVESEGGNILAFIQEGMLYSYNITENKLALLFSFYDKENWDERTLYDAHDIRILTMDETGNIYFVVSGYMNRGNHEGRVGIQIYYFNSMMNTIEEEIFIPYTKSYGLLRQDLKNLAYINQTNHFYFIMGSTLYDVNLLDKSYEIVKENLAAESYQVSASGRMAAWEAKGDSLGTETLVLMDFNTGKQTTVEGGIGCYVRPLGFMGEDLIYGTAYKSDVAKDSSGSILFPMYMVNILNGTETIADTYQKEGIYIVGAEIVENQINLKRVRKGEGESVFRDTSDDQIMNTEIEQAGENMLEIVPTAEYEKIVQIALKGTIEPKSIKFLTPKEVMYEGGRELAIANENAIESYYVYGKTDIEAIFEDLSKAISLADQTSGAVTNHKGEYVWRKGSRNTKNQIMKIESASVTEEKASLAVCLDTMLKCEGIMKNTEYLLSQGKTIRSILADNLPDAQILDLSGCSLDSVLYYVNQDIPVLALLNDGNAVLLVGFNELNTVIMDPVTGTIYKKGMNDSKEWFEKNGNHFITYIK